MFGRDLRDQDASPISGSYRDQTRFDFLPRQFTARHSYGHHPVGLKLLDRTIIRSNADHVGIIGTDCDQGFSTVVPFVRVWFLRVRDDTRNGRKKLALELPLKEGFQTRLQIRLKNTRGRIVTGVSVMNFHSSKHRAEYCDASRKMFLMRDGNNLASRHTIPLNDL